MESFWILLVPFPASSSTKLSQSWEAPRNLPGSSRLSGPWHPRGGRAPGGPRFPWRPTCGPPSDVEKRTSPTKSQEILPHHVAALPGAALAANSGQDSALQAGGRRQGAEPGTAGSDWPRGPGAWPHTRIWRDPSCRSSSQHPGSHQHSCLISARHWPAFPRANRSGSRRSPGTRRPRALSPPPQDPAPSGTGNSLSDLPGSCAQEEEAGSDESAIS